MSVFATLLALAGASAPLPQSATSGWVVHPPEGTRGEVLTLGVGEKQSYRFECTAREVIVTETGVTKLMDLKTSKQIDDGPDAVMPAGAALMALFGGKGQPEFQPADAVKNPVGGWDLTIRLPKADKMLSAVGKSEMMSLFTTGFTTAVVMNADDRAIWNGFLKRCRAGS
jgi:hypothetical protein